MAKRTLPANSKRRSQPPPFRDAGRALAPEAAPWQDYRCCPDRAERKEVHRRCQRRWLRGCLPPDLSGL